MPPIPKPVHQKRPKRSINKVSKKDRTKWKNKSITLAKKIVREIIGCCEYCNKSDVQLHAHHLIPVDFENTADDIENLLVLCARHHRLDKYSAHQNPLWFADWFNAYAPGRKEKLWAKALEIPNFTAQDWKDKYEALKETAKENNIEC